MLHSVIELASWGTQITTLETGCYPGKSALSWDLPSWQGGPHRRGVGGSQIAPCHKVAVLLLLRLSPGGELGWYTGRRGTYDLV